MGDKNVFNNYAVLLNIFRMRLFIFVVLGTNFLKSTKSLVLKNQEIIFGEYDYLYDKYFNNILKMIDKN